MTFRWRLATAISINATAFALVFAYMYSLAPRWLHVRRLRVGIPGLPSEWRGVRVAHLSDFHVGHPHVPADVLRRARDIAISFEPDIVALTGDYFDDGVLVEHCGLFSGWPDGKTLAVMGNHDHRGGAGHIDRVERILVDGGARALRNEAVSVQLRGREAWIAAVDDPYSGRDNLAEALHDIPLGEPALLLLAHAPTVADTLPIGATRLMLCGHTHGGQIRLLPSGRTPLLGTLRWLIGEPQRAEPSIHHGQHWVNGAVISISNGLGMSQLPLRFRTRPQIVLIELDRVEPSLVPCDDIRRYITDYSGDRWWERRLS